MCELWRKQVSSGLSDVYNGRMWKEFQVVRGRPFLSKEYNLAFMFNINWFQPYKHLTSSVGAIYLTIMNLPRSVLFRRENVILIATIPGPHEPHDINPYLEPLVDELVNLWTGMTFQINDGSQMRNEAVIGALLSVACDLPAGRKVCGFLGHSACLGCSRCFKRFLGGVGSMDYSGFDRSLWPPRTDQRHREDVGKELKSKTKQDQSQLESKLGCRYSVLLKLPYFLILIFLVCC